MADATEKAQAVVILNASAGCGCNAEFANKLATQFQTQGMTVIVTLSASGASLIETAQRAVSEGMRTVIAGGGDGTLSAVASALAGTDTSFRVLPLGTLNHFAKDLHIPLDLESAIRTIAEGHTTWVDTGEINGRLFLNNSSLGLYPDTVRERQRQQKRLCRGQMAGLFLGSRHGLILLLIRSRINYPIPG